MVDDEELIELVEMEVRELLDAHEFQGDDTPIIIGPGLEGDTSEIGVPAVEKLEKVLDKNKCRITNGIRCYKSFLSCNKQFF